MCEVVISRLVIELVVFVDGFRNVLGVVYVFWEYN